MYPNLRLPYGKPKIVADNVNGANRYWQRHLYLRGLEDGFLLKCPMCNTAARICHDPQHHQLSLREGKLSASPSVVCPNVDKNGKKCGWQVWIRDGEVIDCK